MNTMTVCLAKDFENNVFASSEYSRLVAMALQSHVREHVKRAKVWRRGNQAATA